MQITTKKLVEFYWGGAMNNLQMRFFKVMVDDRLEALMADADEAAKLAKRLGGSVEEVINQKIAKIFNRWS